MAVTDSNRIHSCDRSRDTRTIWATYLVFRSVAIP